MFSNALPGDVTTMEVEVGKFPCNALVALQLHC